MLRSTDSRMECRRVGRITSRAAESVLRRRSGRMRASRASAWFGVCESREPFGQPRRVTLGQRRPLALSRADRIDERRQVVSVGKQWRVAVDDLVQQGAQ